MNRLFSKIFFRNVAIKEYVTITTDKPIQEKVYFENGINFIDISTIHWLLCLEPMIFGVWLNKNEPEIVSEKLISKIYFTDTVCNTTNAKKKSLAILTVQFCNKLEDESGILMLLQVVKSKIKYLNPVKTFLIFSLHYKKPAISFNKFKALVAAFSYPRKVCLISFQKENYYNIFPMDLLGLIRNCNRYVFGLRHTNSALAKIIETKKIIVSDVSSKHKDIIYKLGKHHSTNPPSINSLPFQIIHSQNFNFPVPVFVHNYKEVKVLNSVNLGSQMLLWGEIINEAFVNNNEDNLYHIHFLLYQHQQKKKANIPYEIV